MFYFLCDLIFCRHHACLPRGFARK